MQNWMNLKKILLSIMLGALVTTAQAAPLSPVGDWKTIDDETGKPRSIVRIWETNGELRGKIMQIFWREDEVKEEVCSKCSGESHNKPLIGMTILWGMTPTGEYWDGGFILDPHNGKSYHGKLSLINEGQQLKVRGYIGIPLIGRSQIWIRQ